MAEKELLFKKKYKCPICDSCFNNLTVKQGKARPERTDMDLKVNYFGIEPLKYDIILCTVCGYATLDRYYERVSAFQRKEIIDKICQSFNYAFEDKDEYDYEDAIVRYKFAFLTSQVKMAKNSEFGILCLKMGWLYRSYAKETGEDDKKKKATLRSQEINYLNKAFDYFEKARATEQSPICGMDELTLDTLLACLCVELNKEDEAKKYINLILSNRNATKRIKDKIFDLKEILYAFSDDYE